MDQRSIESGQLEDGLMHGWGSRVELGGERGKDALTDPCGTVSRSPCSDGGRRKRKTAE